MKLDMKTGELSYFKNDKDLGVACLVEKRANVEYKLAVTLYGRRCGTKFRLVNFEGFSQLIFIFWVMPDFEAFIIDSIISKTCKESSPLHLCFFLFSMQ